MSRSGYTEDCDDYWRHIMWRGAVSSAIRGERGQKLLRELASSMDAMPDKRLIAHELVKEGDVCALGVVGKARGIELEAIDPEDSSTVAGKFDIAEALAREIVWVNDEAVWHTETPEERWKRVRAWVSHAIKEAAE